MVRTGIVKPRNLENKLGWVTSMSFSARDDMVDVTAFGGVRTYIPVLRTLEADLHIVASDPGTLMEVFQEWMNGGVSAPSMQKEYMCLYCASPNSVEFPHCKKCGAPRSFVIG